MKRKKVRIARVKEIKEGQSKKFLLKEDEETLECFLICHKKKFHAYVNRCQHVSLPLDWGDNDFFTEDKKLLMCKNHGALYLPHSGECIEGPCAGLSLKKVPLEIEGDGIYAVLEGKTTG